MGYSTAIGTAIDFWLKYFKNKTLIKTVISTSEALPESTRMKLKEFFGENVNVCARYSNSENGILGQEVYSPGIYSLNWASYFFEILKLDCDEPADEDEIGRIVVTDLYNKAFPMIRYDTGDVAVMKKGSANAFPYFKELYGRKMDLIYDVNGDVIDPCFIDRVMNLAENVVRWQFIQEGQWEYTLKIVPNAENKPSLNNELDIFKREFGNKAVITIDYVDNIPPSPSLKRKPIINNFQPVQ